MRVSQAQRTRAGGTSRAARGSSAASGQFSLPSGSGPVQRPETAAPAAVSSIDVIVALQGVSEPGGERRKAVKNGVKILDLLDEIKVGVLSGGVRSGDLNMLKRIIEQQHELTNEPELADVLKQIDLRARVEIAKLKGNAA